MLFLIIIFSSNVFAIETQTIYAWGIPDEIYYDSGINSIHSFDGFDYFFKSNGSFVIEKDGVEQATYVFGMKGTYNESSVYALSKDYVWDWSVIENNSNRIEVEGKRENYDSVPFKWKINLVVEKDKPFKILNYIKNATAKDVIDLEFFYLFDVNTIANPIVEYKDENGTIKNYSYNTNFLRKDSEGLSNISLNRIKLPFFSFNFQDMIDENYFLTFLYFGNLNDLKNLLPDSNGFIIGFSKGNRILPAGGSFTIDPTVQLEDSYAWTSTRSMNYQETCLNITGTNWNKNYISGEGTALRDGSSKKLFLQFDISGISETVVDANFIWNNIHDETNDARYNGDPILFNINTTSDFTYASSAVELWDHGTTGLIETYQFFRSASWMNLDITSKLNTAISNGDQNFSIVAKVELGAVCTDSTGVHHWFNELRIDYLLFNAVPDVNIITPNTFGKTMRGTQNIDFNIFDSDFLNTGTDYIFSISAKNGGTNDINTVIINDANAFDYCTNMDSNATVKLCTFSFNFAGLATDINFMIDVNVTDDFENVTSVLADYNFTVPSTTFDANMNFIEGFSVSGDLPSFSYYADGNLIIDFNVLYLEANTFLVDFSFSTVSTQGSGTTVFDDVNILDSRFTCANTDFSSSTNCTFDFNIHKNLVPDGNYFALLVFSDDVINEFVPSDNNFLIDNAKPFTTWDGNHNTWQTTDANIHLTCIDINNSGCLSTMYRLDTDRSSSVFLGVWTVFDSNIFINFDGNYQIDFNSTDNAGNIGDTNTFNILIDKTDPSISSFIPSSDTDIDTTTATFTFNINDGNGSGTDYCRIIVFNFDDNSVVSDTNESTCIKTVAIALGQTFFANGQVYDNVNFSSSDSNTSNYTRIVKLPSPPPIGGGGIITSPDIVTPSLVGLELSTEVINLEQNKSKSISLTIISKVNENLPIRLKIADSAKPYLHSKDSLQFTLSPSEMRRIEFEVSSTDADYNALVELGFIDAIIIVNVANGQEVSEVVLKIIPGFPNPFLEFLGQGFIEGVPNGAIIAFIIIIYFLGGVFGKKKKD